MQSDIDVLEFHTMIVACYLVGLSPVLGWVVVSQHQRVLQAQRRNAGKFACFDAGWKPLRRGCNSHSSTCRAEVPTDCVLAQFNLVPLNFAFQNRLRGHLDSVPFRVCELEA